MEQLSSFPDDATREERREREREPSRGGGGGRLKRRRPRRRRRPRHQRGAVRRPGGSCSGQPAADVTQRGQESRNCRGGISWGNFPYVQGTDDDGVSYAESRGEKPCVPKPCGVKFSFYCLSVLLFKLLLGGGNEKTSRNIDISFAKCIERQMHDVVTETSSDFVGRP